MLLFSLGACYGAVMVTETIVRDAAAKKKAGGAAEERSYRLLPHNIDAEQGLLGALLVDNRALEKISDFLKAEHFYMPAHKRIFEAVVKMVDRGQTASPVTLKSYFEKDADLTDVGGAGYLADLAGHVVSVVNVTDYARTIYELHLRRSLITLGEDIVNDSFEHNVERTPSDTIETAEARLFDLAETGAIRDGFQTLRESVHFAIALAEKAKKSEGRVSGVTTGFRDLDQQLGGLHNSDLIILAGRPGMGKTALATNIAYNAARIFSETGGKEGAIVGFFSLEMSSDQLATRILADVADISGNDIRKGNISEEDFRKFAEASQRLTQTPLYIDDTPAQSIAALRTRARRLKRQHGLGLLVIDYLQLMRGTGSRQGLDNRVQEISEISRGLKAIAKELEIPVLALSQLSRAVESREDKKPQLSDLRESGTIEQDADMVLFVFREEYYLKNTEPDKNDKKRAEWEQRMADVKGMAQCIVAKQRHGPTGVVPMEFKGERTRFEDFSGPKDHY